MFSLRNIAQAGSKAKAEAEAKARDDKNAMDKVMADFEKDHGVSSEGGGILGDLDNDDDAADDEFVPTGTGRHFARRLQSTKSGPGTLAPEPGLSSTRTGRWAGYGIPPPSRLLASATRGETALEGGQSVRPFADVIAKATNLPPTIENSRIEALFAKWPSLKVTKVEKIPSSGPATVPKRPAVAMKVNFAKGATTSDFSEAMGEMNDKKYLGKGYYLHLDRYYHDGLSTATKQQEPFAATLHDPEVREKGIAPPEALGGMNQDLSRSEAMTERMLVTADAPPDAVTLRLIHQTIEKVIEGGTEFEAALMQNPWVQEEQRFAWLYDHKHPLNRYYRWRLHQIVSMGNRTDVFANQPQWKGPNEILDEFACEFADFDHPYEDEDSDDENEGKIVSRFSASTGDGYPGRSDTGFGIMSPRSRTQLMWMLSSVPPSSLLYQDIAPISHFAVKHYTRGMDEVVHLLLTNIFQPFALSKANPKNADGEVGSGAPRLQQLTINALYIVSDVIAVTSTSQTFCYKYRLFFAEQLLKRKVFEYLETLPSQLSMGRLSENSYRENVNDVLSHWVNQTIFEAKYLTHFDNAFNAQKREQEMEEKARKKEAQRAKKKGKVLLKSVGGLDSAVDYDEDEDEGGADVDDDSDNSGMNVDQVDMAAVDTRARSNDDQDATNVSDGPLPIDGMDVTGDMGKKSEPGQHSTASPEIAGETAAARARRLRPKAEDMFASDEE